MADDIKKPQDEKPTMYSPRKSGQETKKSYRKKY